MTPHNNPWLEGWMRAMNAASQFWLRPMGLTSLPRPDAPEAQPPRATEPAPAPLASSGRAHDLELTDGELRDALHARLAELHAFLNDTIAGQFVRRAAMSEELDGLRNELDQALGALERLRAERDALVAGRDTLTAGRDALAADLAARAESFGAEREAFGNRILQLELAVGERDATLEALGAERDALVVGIDEIRAESARMHDALDEEVRRLRGEVARLESEMTDAVRAVEQAHGRADAGAARIAWLEPAVETMRAELEASAADRDTLRERVTAATAALEQAGAEIDRATSMGPALEATRAELERVAAERDGLAVRAAALETQLGEMLAERERARGADVRHEARIRDLEPQVIALGRELERVGAEREQLAADLVQVEAERSRAVAERDEAQRETEKAQAQANAMEPVLLGLRAELQRVATEREALVGRVAALEAALASRPATPDAGSAARAAAPMTTASPDAPAAAGATSREASPTEPGADRRTGPEDAAPRVWPFQLASPPGASAAPTAPVTRLPQRRAAVELHFRKPPGWADTVFMHAWTPAGPLSVWPGVRMTAEGAGWYGARIEGVGEVRVVFNDSCGHQTGDLHRDGDGWFAEGEWHSERPEGLADVVRLTDYPARIEKVGPR